jgi:hypothetical protein
MAVAVPLAGSTCPSTLAMHVNSASSHPSLEGRRDPQSTVHFFKITLALIHLLFLSP